MSSIIDKILTAKTSQRSDQIRDGQYLFMVRKLVLGDMEGGQTFVAELEVIESCSKGDLDPITKQPVVPNFVKSIVGYVQQLQKHPSAPGNAQKFLNALLGADGADPKKIENAITNLLSEEGQKTQGARGLLVRGSTYQQIVKSGPNTGKINTYTSFFNVPDSEQGDIAARAAKISG